MSEIHLRRAGFTHSACGPFNKNKETKKNNNKETDDSRYIYQNE